MTKEVEKILVEKRERILQLKAAYEQRDEHLKNKVEECYKKVNHYANETQRIVRTLDNVHQIIDDLDVEFAKQTNLNYKDIEFLFFAITIQCIGWYFSPKITNNFSKISTDERHSAGADGQLEFQQGEKIALDNKEDLKKSKKYPDKSKMFLIAVPYDVMEGTKNVEIPGISEIGKNIYGKNHHVATMGHDPILGYLFGTINILTRTVTFKTPTLQTNLVRLRQGSNRSQYLGPEIGFIEALRRAIESASEDFTRVPAAILRQSIHMQSDKFTKQGLPIPIIDAERAQALLEQGWNSYELERMMKFGVKNIAVVGIQAVIRCFLNVIIETMHTLLFDENKDKNFNLYQVRTKKILMYSNVIASNSNVIYAAICRDTSKLDVGGILVTIYRILNDREFIREIKQEFIYGQYRDRLHMREYQG